MPRNMVAYTTSSFQSVNAVCTQDVCIVNGVLRMWHHPNSLDTWSCWPYGWLHSTIRRAPTPCDTFGLFRDSRAKLRGETKPSPLRPNQTHWDQTKQPRPNRPSMSAPFIGDCDFSTLYFAPSWPGYRRCVSVPRLQEHRGQIESVLNFLPTRIHRLL